MTKKELEIAQFLHHTATRAEALAMKLDPKMKNIHDPEHFDQNTILVAGLDALSRTARYHFRGVVGRGVQEVHSTDLNTEFPAEWTRLPMIDGRRGAVAPEATETTPEKQQTRGGES